MLFFSVSSPCYASSKIVVNEGDIIDRVIVAAPQTLIAKEELGEVEAGYMSSKSIFDTNLSAESNYNRDEYQRSSAFFGTRTDTANWNVGVAKKLPIGMSTSLDWSNHRVQLFGQSTIGGSTVFPTGPTYNSILNFSLSQSMMKNFAGLNDRSVVNMAKQSLLAADLGTKYRVATIANRALSLYWQLVISNAYISARIRAVDDAINFLNITMGRKDLGTVEETDVLAARANLIGKRNGLLAAKRLSENLEKELKNLLAYSVDDKIVPHDKSPKYIEGAYLNVDEGIRIALENRWDYLARKEEVKRENVNVVSSKNKRWPSLDLVSTLAVNGLTGSYSNTMDNVDHPNWTVGMQFSFPLENRYARADYKTAKHKKAKVLIELKKMENDIANTISELVNRVKINEKIYFNATEAKKLQREKLDKETNKYSMGRSSSELIVLYQDDLIRSEISALDAWADYITTILDLKLAENTLIDL